MKWATWAGQCWDAQSEHDMASIAETSLGQTKYWKVPKKEEDLSNLLFVHGSDVEIN